MGKLIRTCLHRRVSDVITPVVLLGILVLSTNAVAQTGSTGATVRHTFNAGINLVSVPFEYSGDSTTELGNPCRVLGLSTSAPSKSDFDFLTWLAGGFYEYPNLPADKLRLGVGYFLYSPSTSRDVMATDDVVGLESNKLDPFVIDLYNGWNLIGDPYHSLGGTGHSVRWYGSAISILAGNAEYSVRDAVSAGILKAGLWSYVGGRYELTYTMDEWKGLWVKVFQNCQLYVRRSETASRGAARPESGTDSLADKWSQRIVARAGSAPEDSVFLGVSSDATDGYDKLRDIEKPPAVTVTPYTYIVFPHPEWRSAAGNYGVDVRATGGRELWSFVVSSNVSGSDLVLTWPGITSLPKDVNLVLFDEETGVRRGMRTASSYRFRLATGASSRRFSIESLPAGQGVLKISGLSANASRDGSRTIACSLSSGACVDVSIRSAAGNRTIRAIARSVTRAAGLNQFVWDGRDDTGSPVPSGIYLCEVRATGDDGQVVKAVAVLTVAR